MAGSGDVFFEAEAIRPGAIVAWWDGSEPAFGFVVGEEKQRVRLILAGGREVRVRPSRLIAVLERTGVVPGPSVEDRRGAGDHVTRAEKATRERAAEVDSATVWEVIRETGEVDRPWTVEELAELSLGSPGAESRIAVMLALHDDGVRFVRRGDGWQPRSVEAVNGLLQQRERVARKQDESQAFFSGLRSGVRGEPYEQSGSEQEGRYLKALEQLALLGEETPAAQRNPALEALAASGLRFDRAQEGAFRLLRVAGRFTHDDENLAIVRYGLSRQFPPEVVQRADTYADMPLDASRRDLTALDAFSIDGPRTREIDDLLSLEGQDDRFRLGIHIADPGAFVKPDDVVDREALARGLTVYFADARLTMLPPALSENAASLMAGDVRPALSLLVDVENGSVVGYEIVRSRVRSVRRWTYAEADRALEGGQAPEALRQLDRIADRLRARRVDAGAIVLEFDEADPHVDPDGDPVLDGLPGDSPARRIVTEAMILAGELAARYCSDEQIPVLYRGQTAPQTALEAGGVIEDPVIAQRVRRNLRRGEISLQPEPHFALGLSDYCQMTSPLRRFQDLVNQRQIAARLQGRPLPYDAGALRRLAAETDSAAAEARRAEATVREYWLLRYLERSLGQEIEGMVLETEPRALVRLTETRFEHRLRDAEGLRPGDRLKLRVMRVNPRAGLLSLQRSTVI